MQKFISRKPAIIIMAGFVMLMILIVAVSYVAKRPASYITEQSHQRGSPISPFHLLPYVSHQQTRMTICEEVEGEFFRELCQKKFDSVGKNDKEKIDALFSVLERTKNDQNLSDYERYALGQVVFASLPTKNSPLAWRSSFSELASLTGYRIAYAEEATVNMSEVGQLLVRELERVLSDLPPGDNAWVINVMVSQHSWVGDQRQPIYSEQYGESFDPFPNNPQVNERDIEYHVRAIVGSLAASQQVFDGSPYEGFSGQLAYSFSISSWKSQSYAGGEQPGSEKYLTSRYHFTEENYRGDDILSDVLASVKMPSRQQLATDQITDTGKTAWGKPATWETAYESYFWMYVQSPERFPTFWDAYNNNNDFTGKMLRDLPLGAPVDLRVYFHSPGVKEYYQYMASNNKEMLSLGDFLNAIDKFQANLTTPRPTENPTQKPQESAEEQPPASVDPQVEEFDRWLRECANRPPPQSRAELEEYERQKQNPAHPCYDPDFKPCKKAADGTCLPDVMWTVPR